VTDMAEATGTTDFRLEFSARPQALACVRRLVGLYVQLWGFGQLANTVVLCTHELLSNVQEHTRSADCVLALQRQVTGVRVVVSDTSNELPTVRAPAWNAERGRGMVVLTTFAVSWGAAVTESGKDVWAEFRTLVQESAA
jgi:hypothetical protein